MRPVNYTGIVDNGCVRLPPNWKNGTAVRVEAVDLTRTTNRFTRRLLEIAAKTSGLPPDLSMQHDNYLYGRVKR
jgi:hypothetical protein